MKRRISGGVVGLEDAETSEDFSVQYKRERRKARKVVVERLRRERIDRCLEQLKLWLQDSMPSSSLAITQDELCNLEKADILELTVNNLRQMVASTQIQYSIGYSACVQEVDQFMHSFRFDDVTRRRIVQHLCRRVEQASVSGSGSSSESPSVKDSQSSVEYEHLRMCAYSSGIADSTTGSSDTCEPSTTLESHDVIAVVENQLKCESPTQRGVLVTSTRSFGIDLTSHLTRTCSSAETDSFFSDESDSSLVVESVWRPW